MYETYFDTAANASAGYAKLSSLIVFFIDFLIHSLLLRSLLVPYQGLLLGYDVDRITLNHSTHCISSASASLQIINIEINLHSMKKFVIVANFTRSHENQVFSTYTVT